MVSLARWSSSSHHPQDGKVKVLGNKTEGALLVVVDRYGVDYDEVRVSFPSHHFRQPSFADARRALSSPPLLSLPSYAWTDS